MPACRGPTLLEDFVLREKITHFDHERIPERIVHARGSGAHGYFELDSSLSQYTRAQFLQKKGTRTPVFARFSTVAGGAGSVDLPRDVRGFAVKFYTQEGNFDLVGNNIPVFFIQDAMKFSGFDPRRQNGARPRLPASRKRTRYLLGLHLPDAGEHPHDPVGNVGPGHPPLAAHDGGLRRPYVPSGGRQGQLDVREISLAPDHRVAIGCLGRGRQDQRR